MKIADGIEALRLVMERPGRAMEIYPTLLWDHETAAIVDVGFHGQEEELRRAVEEAGVPFGKVGAVIVTHQDVDHIGGLPGLLGNAEHRVKVYSHSLEKPYIEGDKPLLKSKPAEFQKLTRSDTEQQRQNMAKQMANPPSAPVDQTVEDGDILPFGGGVRVIFTPGHTLGHISLYHMRSKTLITGDALVANSGVLSGPRPDVAYEIETARRSVQKFVPYEIRTVICYHGGVVSQEAGAQIARLAEELNGNQM